MAGFLLQKELDYLDGAVKEPKRPFAAIVGGSKVRQTIPSQFSMLPVALLFASYVSKTFAAIVGGSKVRQIISSQF